MPCESPAIAAHHWEPPMIPNVGPGAWRCPHPVPASIEAHGQALPDMAQTNANSSTSRFIVLLSWYHNVTFQVAGDALHRTDTSSSSWFQSPNLGSRNTSEQQAAAGWVMGGMAHPSSEEPEKQISMLWRFDSPPARNNSIKGHGSPDSGPAYPARQVNSSTRVTWQILRSSNSNVPDLLCAAGGGPARLARLGSYMSVWFHFATGFADLQPSSSLFLFFVFLSVLFVSQFALDISAVAPEKLRQPAMRPGGPHGRRDFVQSFGHKEKLERDRQAPRAATSSVAPPTHLKTEACRTLRSSPVRGNVIEIPRRFSSPGLDTHLLQVRLSNERPGLEMSDQGTGPARLERVGD
ncbi:hypothetical protein CPAR01_12499 [Colletotrichum paranaense]|uniref:Uncharacterized protein n=1 Tax=Colletotrichum paranaense TaxID=1914294 RepID=A0ABQ9S6L2_9PEZI|nr:uncharacterized protein CPAR01_12499 [Colletotrichum paranaense]KAK1527941.1 hypothetical protein CPAR01_12499 [Colletotrichum paranaense]